MKKLILLIIFLLTICGCSTTKKVQREIVYQYEEIHDTIKDLRVDIIKDSIFLHDSIVVVRDTAGKVVYKERYVYRDLWHDGETKVVHDSIVVFRDKSEANNETEVTKYSNKLRVYGICSIGILFIIFLFWIIRKLLK